MLPVIRSERKNFHTLKVRAKQLVKTFYDGSNHPQLKIRLRNRSFILNDWQEIEKNSMYCLQIIQF